MKVKLTVADQQYEIDVYAPIDISIPLEGNDKNPLAWYIDRPEIGPVIMGEFVGSVSSGRSSTNFNSISFNPHAHGTHTECLGHITHAFYSVQDALTTFFFLAELITIQPVKRGGDWVITKDQIQSALQSKLPEAVVIRTQPNEESKKHQNYSHTNPPYLLEEAARFLCDINVKHLLVDLPSVDKEKDAGRLLAHKAFWNVQDVVHVNDDARFFSTITEFVFVPDLVQDGTYLLNLQISSFVNDAAPSKPILYALK